MPMSHPIRADLLLPLLFAAVLPAQQLVLPDNHHLCENPNQLGNTGSAVWWRATEGRFQVLYEASHFVGTGGMTGPVFLTRLRFRGEDGEPNLGGQVYTGVTVQLGSTTLTSGTLSATFATNRTPPAPHTTTFGAVGTTNVTVQPSVGSTPNNWCIDIDLVAIGAAIVFDPTGAEPNLLVEVTMPNAPSNAAPLALIPIQDTTGGTLLVRGAGTSAPLATTAPVGTLSTMPPVLGLEFAGPGGFATIHPARNERYGAACGGACSTFYEAFLNGQAFDLGGGLTLVPDDVAAPNYYLVLGGAPPVDLTQLNATPNSIADDALVTHTLGFTHRYPGGTTTTIKPCTNGFVWLDDAMMATTLTPVVDQLLGVTTNATARHMLYWMDLHAGRNAPTHPNSGLHVHTDTSAGPGQAVCYVTWNAVGMFRTPGGASIGGHAVLTFQCVLHEATGIVEYRYGPMPPYIGSGTTTADAVPVVVGFTRGRLSNTPVVGSRNPQSRDLSIEVPFTTDVEGARGHMGLTVTGSPKAGGLTYGGRAFSGQSLTYGAVDVPPGAILGALLLDVQAARPGLQIPGITAPRCMVSTSANPIVWQLYPLPGGTITGSPIPIASGLEGADMYAQIVVLDGLFQGGDLVTVASNAMKHTFGLD
ncbi:MAG: hypothetical protein KF830_10090 [Planctomycetes bacterium]|nr:hypothetical protein [Planctomycetota bacterium]